MIVDAHQHFWDPQRADYPFLSEVPQLSRRFAPEDLAPLLAANDVAGTIVVQARPSLTETRELLALVEAVPFVFAAVGWVDLTADVPAQLARFDGALVGIRHQVHDEPDPNWLRRADVRRGLRAIGNAGLCFDLLVREAELPAAIEVVRELEEQSFVLDHVAKPPFRDLARWSALVAALAALPNVFCKLSGLYTEADPGDDLHSIVRRAVEWFGPDRCLFGSDWPVCTLAATYDETIALVRDVVGPADAAAVLGTNALRIYDIGVGVA